jgi:hypothetical protein
MLLAELPFYSVFTSNYDDLLERSFARRKPQALDSSSASSLSDALREGTFTIFHVYGQVRRMDSLLVSRRELRQALYNAPELQRSIAAMLAERTFLFLGLSPEGLEDFLGTLAPIEIQGRRHFALMPSRNDITMVAERFRSLFNIELLVYPARDGFAEFEGFVRTLHREVFRYMGDHSRPPSVATRWPLRRVTLSNIGPFEQLDLRFNNQFTALLGDNGAGKSTVLRAIGLALAGKDEVVEKAGEFLLRSGATRGKIEIEIDNTVYVTDLVRDADRVRVRPQQVTPLEAGKLLVLGFSALRGATSAPVLGPKSDRISVPSGLDGAPLVNGLIETRLDDVRQWGVNLAVRAGDGSNASDIRAFEAFKDLFKSLAPGRDIRFIKVDSNSWNLMVSVKGDIVPLSALSQGMSSIFSWAGTLLQRLDHFHPGGAPQDGQAVVLVDEIDAHLHPSWQRTLVNIVRTTFPGTQFVVSSHSPLVVSSLPWQDRPGRSRSTTNRTPTLV